MNTPLWEASSRYLAGDPSRFHMPGHKGQPLAGLGDIARFDLTEVTGMDSLYEAQGCIASTEEAYSQLYGAAGTLLSAGGSTLCIQTMLALAAAPGNKILAARGVHTAAVNAMALLDLHPVWIYPSLDPETGLAQAISPRQVEDALAQELDIAAVYITSPSYFGIISDVAAISAVCKRYQVPLLVDNAHGAHLQFCAPSLHPIALGADMCCDSLHKSLPVLTGGAALHIGNEIYLPQAKARMALFGSTSPSYLILLSMDTALDYLVQGLRDDTLRVSSLLRQSAELAKTKGFQLPDGTIDPMRLTLGFASAGYTRDAFLSHLGRYHLEPEYTSERFCVFLATGFNRELDFHRLEHALEAVMPAPPIPLPLLPFPHPRSMRSPREALFAPSRELPVLEAAGHISSSMVIPCPPGIPLVVCGEYIDEDMAMSLKSYGIRFVNVVK